MVHRYRVKMDNGAIIYVDAKDEDEAKKKALVTYQICKVKVASVKNVLKRN